MLGQTDYEYVDPGYGGTAPTEPSASATAEEWANYLLQAAQIYTSYDLQSKMLDVNLSRAQQGLPPLDLSQYGVGVNVGVAPSTQNMILIGLAIVAGAYILPKLMRGR